MLVCDTEIIVQAKDAWGNSPCILLCIDNFIYDMLHCLLMSNCIYDACG